MIKHKPHLFGVGVHRGIIDSIEIKEDSTIKINVSNHRLKGYQDLLIPANSNELVNKLLNVSSNIEEVDKNADICTKVKQAKLEGSTINVKLVCNEHGRIVLEDIIDEEKYKEQIKRVLENCKVKD